MTRGNRYWSNHLRVGWALFFLSFAGCSADDRSPQPDAWPNQGGTGGVSGGAASGGGPQAGSSSQTAGDPGSAAPVAGAAGAIPEAGSSGATAGVGGDLDVMDGGVDDGGGGFSGGAGAAAYAGASGDSGTGGSGGANAIGGCEVTAVPEAIRTSHNLDPFYQKYADANGIPVATSSQVADEAVTLACQLVKEMVSLRDDVRQALISSRMRFTLIAANEELSSIPEVNASFGTSLNWRARGLGGLIPTVCAEENILCQVSVDLWRGENICVHEYAHTMMDWGLAAVDPTASSRLDSAYQAAQASGDFANTYAIDSPGEFWAEGVQDWYNSNLESIPADGVHNSINTREELLQASPALHDLIAELIPEDIQFNDCYAVQ